MTIAFQTPGYDLSYKEIRKAVRPSELAKIIAIDIHFNMTLAEFALIHQYLSKSDCLVLVNAMDDRAPMSKDLTMVAPGLFIKAVADCASRDPVVFGKPSQLLAEYILGEFQIETPKRILFIGDNLNADVKFAKRLGFQTLFMLSGAHTKEEMLLQSLEDQPNYYADSMADFLSFFADYNLANELNGE